MQQKQLVDFWVRIYSLKNNLIFLIYALHHSLYRNDTISLKHLSSSHNVPIETESRRDSLNLNGSHLCKMFKCCSVNPFSKFHPLNKRKCQYLKTKFSSNPSYNILVSIKPDTVVFCRSKDYVCVSTTMAHGFQLVVTILNQRSRQTLY